MAVEAQDDLPPLSASATILREVAVLGANMGNLKETFDDFRRETRDNFDAQKNDAQAIREEMRRGFDGHDLRIKGLEEWRATERGGLSVGKWIWGASIALVGAVGTILGWFGAQ